MNETKKEFEARFGHEPPKGGIYGYIQHQNWMRRLQDWTEAYEAGEIAMREKAAAVCELGNSPHIGCLANSPEGNIYVPSGGTCHVAMARAIRALPLSGAEESTDKEAIGTCQTPRFPVGRCKHCGQNVLDAPQDGQTIIFCSYECYCMD